MRINEYLFNKIITEFFSDTLMLQEHINDGQPLDTSSYVVLSINRSINSLREADLLSTAIERLPEYQDIFDAVPKLSETLNAKTSEFFPKRAPIN